MNNTEYTKEVIKHFSNPKNMGEMKNPDAIGILGNPICGDVFKVYLKIGKNKKNQEIIKDIKFQTMGCAAAISTSSMITELAKGKTVMDAKKITNKDVASSLKGLPPIKMHCSNMAADTLQKAILVWEKKK
jgi:nitrogen fixation NifU-like protein